MGQTVTHLRPRVNAPLCPYVYQSMFTPLKVQLPTFVGITNTLVVVQFGHYAGNAHTRCPQSSADRVTMPAAQSALRERVRWVWALRRAGTCSGRAPSPASAGTCDSAHPPSLSPAPSPSLPPGSNEQKPCTEWILLLLMGTVCLFVLSLTCRT